MTCAGHGKDDKPTEQVEVFPGVKANLCKLCKGGFYADLISNLKAYGFKADQTAHETWDEIKV